MADDETAEVVLEVDLASWDEAWRRPATGAAMRPAACRAPAATACTIESVVNAWANVEAQVDAALGEWTARYLDEWAQVVAYGEPFARWLAVTVGTWWGVPWAVYPHPSGGWHIDLSN